MLNSLLGLGICLGRKTGIHYIDMFRSHVFIITLCKTIVEGFDVRIMFGEHFVDKNR